MCVTVFGHAKPKKLTYQRGNLKKLFREQDLIGLRVLNAKGQICILLAVVQNVRILQILDLRLL